MIRVLIADDHDVVRTGLRLLLEQQDDIEVVGEACDGQEALDLAVQLAPDILLMDITMPCMDGNEATCRVCALGLPTRVVILSMHSDEAIVHTALESGARGYLVKATVRADLIPAVHAAYRGETYLSPSVANVVVKQLLGQTKSSQPVEEDPINRLSERERQVLRLIALGHTNKTMAQVMRISSRTVEKHRASLMNKLNASDLATLVQIALQAGFVGMHK
jgi:DNA-binding NarL/FixJ family response regulator